MSVRRLTAIATAVAAIALAAAGCGGGGGGSTTTAAAPAAGTASLTVPTTSGTLRGTATADARRFRGVRFAQPPVGRLRWALPQPVEAASGEVDATRPGARCAQTGSRATASTAEDCLFLDVTTPRDVPAGARLPVMVWWHGGGYTTGSGADYDAQRLASEGRVIVVTPNKRLGVFGYLGLPGLPGSGDFGFADQLAATRWAKQNAAAFGGDPGNVTVFGESDGGMAACALLTSPAARGLVSKVAISSGSCALRWPEGGLLAGTPAQRPYVSRAASEALGTATAKGLGCRGADRLACLRALPVKRLLPASINYSNQLAYGTDLLPRDPAAAVRDGDVARIPVLSGGNSAEELSFVGGVQQAKPSTFTARTYPTLLATAFGRERGAAVRREYPLADFRSAALAFATVMTDAAWACPTATANAQLARRTTVHAYEFADPDAPDVNQITTPEVPQGPAHATDVPSLFDPGGESLLRTPAQRTLGRTMVGYWSSFARTGTPTAAGAPAWPALEAGETTALRLAPGRIATTDVGAEHRCAFWSGLSGR